MNLPPSHPEYAMRYVECSRCRCRSLGDVVIFHLINCPTRAGGKAVQASLTNIDKVTREIKQPSQFGSPELQAPILARLVADKPKN